MFEAFGASVGSLPDRLLSALLPATERAVMREGANRPPCWSCARVVATAGRPIGGSTCG